MLSKIKMLNHGDILKNLKTNMLILNLIYTREDNVKWTSDEIYKTIVSYTNLSINKSDELLMRRLKCFFNISVESNLTSTQ